MMSEIIACLRKLVLCACVPIVLVGGSFLACAGVLHIVDSRDDRATRLHVTVQTAREIQRALATPVPQPPPLGPITAARARPLPSSAAIMRPEGKRKKSPNGYDAMARGSSAEWSANSSRTSGSSVVYDRHALQ